MSYLALNNRDGALEQYQLLKQSDAARADKLFKAMNPK